MKIAPGRDRWWLVVAAGLAVFMASVDLSIVNVALPAIERDLKVTTSVTEWVVLAYLLPLAGLALPSGRWLDSVGRRPALLFSLTGFALASVAVGLSSLLLSAAVAALLLSLSFAASWGPVWVLLALVGVPLLLLWLRMPGSGAFRELLRAPGEAGPHLALASSAAAIGTVFFIAPYFMQRQLGESVSAAGVTVLAFPAGMALTGPVGGILGDWWGAQRTAALGAALFTAGLCLLIPMSGSWGLSDLAGRLFLAGCGTGLFNAPNMALAMAPPRASS